MDARQHLPDANRLSVLAATILLVFALIPFINTPGRVFSLQLPGLFLQFPVNFASLTPLLAAAMAASGMSWLLQGHPQAAGRSTAQHWMIPALTAWVISVPLNTLKIGWQWWAVFSFGGILLVLVFLAEYIIVDPGNANQAPAAVGLTAVSFGLYLTLCITLHAANARLYFTLPALVGSAFLVSLRSLYLRLDGHWCVAWAIGIALVIGQAAIGLHYWPISSLRYGLILLGLGYALTSLAGLYEEGRTLRSLWVEPTLMLCIFWALAFLIG